MKDDSAIYKFNNGNGALLCSKCRVIIRAGVQLTQEDWSAMRGEIKMSSQYCKQCKYGN